MPWFKYTLLALGSLFVILDPVAVVPAFIAMTPETFSGVYANAV